MVTICKGKYGKLKAIKSSSIRLEGYLKNGMCSRCRTKWYAIRRWNMLYQTGKAEFPLTFGGKYAKKTMEILVRLQQRRIYSNQLETKEIQSR